MANRRKSEELSTKDKKKLRWAHVSSIEVSGALNGLLENAIVVLPESCVQASGIQPNISDKNDCIFKTFLKKSS
jgi:hypothetical protein